jgi:hypothetical protein
MHGLLLSENPVMVKLFVPDGIDGLFQLEHFTFENIVLDSQDPLPLNLDIFYLFRFVFLVDLYLLMEIHFFALMVQEINPNKLP